MENFMDALTSLLNRHCMENESNTPNYILATYMKACLDTFNAAVNERIKWYGGISDQKPYYPIKAQKEEL